MFKMSFFFLAHPVGDNLTFEIKTPTNDEENFTSYLENPTMNKLQFRYIAEEDTMKAIDNLENKNSSGHDGISNKLLKSIRYELCKPLTLIIYNRPTPPIIKMALLLIYYTKPTVPQ